ncbi:MAG TPA: response regulator transcription factor [Actinotalea sp.]|nr:response regulator transcription factor [Actinotalea sp.]
MKSTMPTVLVVHSSCPVRLRILTLLTTEHFRVLGMTGSTASGLALARRQPVDLVLVDSCAAGDVRAMIRTLAADAGVGHVVVLAPSDDDAACADLVLDGAFGVVTTGNLDTLPVCLHAVLRGEAALSRRLVGLLLEEYRERAQARARVGPASACLTDREAQVLEMLRRGRTTREIAEHLVIAPVTVRSHIASATHKLHVHSRPEAVAAVAPRPQRARRDAARLP